MEKYELLKKIGFSEEYISNLRDYESQEIPVFESMIEDDKRLSIDTANIIVDQTTHYLAERLTIIKR